PGFIQGDLAAATNVTVYDNTWRSSATQYRNQAIGTRHTYVCPANATTSERSQTIWGTDMYTDDSPVCVAAVHAGKINFANGGAVTFEIRGAQTSFTGSTRNGVTSSPFGSWGGSYRFP
ncbi:MAG TPA: LCCL domain-containing protein, partial [Longimicrobium sp.]|nr:LCCL domain-containing protein [Longimicrobium sp.]